MKANGKTIAILLAAICPAPLGGCDGVKISDASIEVIDGPRVAAAADDPGTVLLDVRTAEAYAAGHLPGAVHIFLPDLRTDDERLADAERIIVYADGWNDPLSTAGAKELMKLGYDNVHEFKGGVQVWTDAGGELVEPASPGEARPEAGDE